MTPVKRNDSETRGAQAGDAGRLQEPTLVSGIFRRRCGERLALTENLIRSQQVEAIVGAIALERLAIALSPYLAELSWRC